MISQISLLEGGTCGGIADKHAFADSAGAKSSLWQEVGELTISIHCNPVDFLIRRKILISRRSSGILPLKPFTYVMTWVHISCEIPRWPTHLRLLSGSWVERWLSEAYEGIGKIVGSRQPYQSRCATLKNAGLSTWRTLLLEDAAAICKVFKF